MTTLTTPSARDHGSILDLKFSTEDVLNEKKDMMLRMSSLLKSVTYQSVAEEPVIIYAQGTSSCVKITDVVDSVEEDRVNLKGGISIPIKSILKIEISL